MLCERGELESVGQSCSPTTAVMRVAEAPFFRVAGLQAPGASMTVIATHHRVVRPVSP